MKRDISEADVRALRSQLEGELDHPNLEQELFLFVDGTLPPERHAAVEAHLESCARCREDVNDLLAVRPRAAGEPRRWPAYAAAAAVVVALVGGSVAVLRDVPKPVQNAGVKPVPSRPVPQPPVPVPAVVTASQPPVVTATQPPPARPGYARREWEKLVRAARSGTRLAMPAVLQAVRPGAERLRGTQNQTGALHPAGVIVETPRPTFTWPAREGARAVVSVFQAGQEVARSEPRAEPRWRPNRDLHRGVTYTWEVELEQEGQMEILPSPPTPVAQFRVLDKESQAELEAARREHADDHLLLGLLYAKAGLDDQARAELQRVGPPDVDTARRLLADIDTWDSSQ